MSALQDEKTIFMNKYAIVHNENTEFEYMSIDIDCRHKA